MRNVNTLSYLYGLKQAETFILTMRNVNDLIGGDGEEMKILLS